jgi:hypothetical protein
MKKYARWSILGVAVVVAGMLLINPSRPGPADPGGTDLLATNSPPAEIVSMLKSACYDCHSDETKWPWYARVAPVSWWLVDHVNEGRAELTFSDWPHDDPRRAAKKWRSIASNVESAEMPLPSYTWGHPEARLTSDQRQAFVDWARAEANRLAPVSDE